MFNFNIQRLNRSQQKNALTRRSGIVLLVVLGMLTLFSVLAVSYLVFTTNQKSAAASINRAEALQVDTNALVESAVAKLLVGSRGPDSSLWGHDLLGDLYGMRDSVLANVAPSNAFTGPTSEVAPAVLLGNQFVRFPSLLYLESPSNPRFTPLADPRNFPLGATGVNNLISIYPYRRNDNELTRRYPGYPGSVAPLPLDPTTHQRPSFPHDDELNGRLLTFTGGPLEGLTFPIARYFGDHRTAGNGRAQLTGQVVLDVREHLPASITIGGTTRPLHEWLSDTGFRIDRLFYDYPAAAAALPAGAQGHASFYINGRMLNGPGLGWDRPRTRFDPLSGVNRFMGVDRRRLVGTDNPVRPFNLDEVVSTDLNITRIERGVATGAEAVPVTGVPYQVPTGAFNPADPAYPLRNGPDVPVALQGHYAIHRLAPEEIPGTTLESFLQDLPPGDTDEPYDAPDYNNLFLSYMPTDAILGESAPSFVRPAMLNWIINNQDGTPSVPRLRQALVALQRSTLRPIPFAGDPMIPAAVSDRGEGVKRLSYENFTGSNTTVGLNEPINFNSTDSVYLLNKLVQVARALAGRDDDGDGFIDSWDVDNNGDGLVDSVWVDAGLPLTQTPDGRLVKPMVSYLVEDLGGRVNINLAGNIAQGRNIITASLAGAVQHGGAIRRPATNPNVSPALVFNTNVFPPTYNDLDETNLPYGWGYGPAEIEIRSLFPPQGTIGQFIAEWSPLTNYTADNLIRGPQRLIGERLGVFSSQLGRARPYANMNDAAYGQIVAVPGYLRDPVTNSGNDLAGTLRNPNRPNLHRFLHPQGLPIDAYGRGSVGLGVNGDLVVGGTSHVVTNGGNTAGDSSDDPYEMDITASTEPDAPYTYADLEPLLRLDGFDRGLLSDRLISIIEDFHNNQAVGTETLEQLRRALADSMTTNSNSVATVRGGLPSEFFENTFAATSASSPQVIFPVSIGAGTKQALNAVMWELMPEELRSGRKLNLNRPFGNGFDDDLDGVIDDDNNGVEYAGTSLLPDGVKVFDPNPPPGRIVNEPHYLGDGGAVTEYSSSRGNNTPLEPYQPYNGAAARQRQRDVTARAQFAASHLYVLAMVLLRDANRNVAFDFPHTYPDVDTFPDSPFIPGTPGNNEQRQAEFAQEYRAWKIAQWAANVADFRDADGVMTRFDYDPFPFDGWDVNLNNPATYRTVWGLERPELTLEESLAFHDRRVRDTADDAGAQESLLGSAGTASRGDNDMDQWRLPQGSLFLELRNTRSPQIPRDPTSAFEIATRPNAETNPVANTSSYPPELYTFVGGEWVLNLGAVTPGNNIPVWRVAISEIHAPGAQAGRSATVGTSVGNPTSPYYQAAPDLLLQPVGSEAIAAAGLAGVTMDRDTATLQPERPKFFIDPAATGNPDDLFQAQHAIDRVVFFANSVNPTNIVNTLADVYDEGQVFYNRLANGVYPNGGVFVRGGQNVVIGPRADTRLGSRETDSGGAPTHDATTDAPIVAYADYESDQRIELSSTQVTYYDVDGNDQTPTYDGLAGPVVNATIRPIVGIQAAADPPAAWTNINSPIGVNVSEPLPYETAPAGRSYYTEPTESLDSTNGYPVDSYKDYSSGNGVLPDRPFDADAAMSELFRAFGPSGQQTGTRTHFKTAYLQRLANPTQPYDAEFNPYITVDYITIDLTVFNGSDDNNVSLQDNMGTDLSVDDDDDDPYGTAPLERFASRYKTGKTIIQDKADANYPNLMHSVNTYPPEPTATDAGAGVAYFKRNLNIDPLVVADANSDVDGDRTVHSSTLGYVNHSFGSRWQQGSTPYNLTSPSIGQAQPTIMPFVGTPYQGFAANVIWLNRPFVSAEELMWVPVSTAGRFPFEFGSAVGQTTTDQYNSATNLALSPPPVPPALPPAKTPADEQRYDFNQRFTYLWNYFSSSNNVFAYHPATYETDTGTDTLRYPWTPDRPTAANGYVGVPDTNPSATPRRINTPPMTRPYSEVAEQTPAPNFWRLLEWVEVPPPFDFDNDFVNAEGNFFNLGEDSLFGPRIDFRTLGPTPATNQPTLAAVEADPRSWTSVIPGPNLGWNRGTGQWENNAAVNGRYNGFWTNDVTMELFRPPFGFRSKLFRKGQINLNTVKNLRVYKALDGRFFNDC